MSVDEVTIELDGEIIHLRPTLRAASRLEKRYGGFSNLIVSITEGKLSAIADVITHASSKFTNVPAFLATLEGRPLGADIERIIPAIVQLVLMMAGVSEAPTERADENDHTERITFAKFFEALFGYATGIVGWPPQVAWDATAAEILCAYRARVELLRAIFGSKQSDDDATGPRNHSTAEIAKGLSELHALSFGGANVAA